MTTQMCSPLRQLPTSRRERWLLLQECMRGWFCEEPVGFPESTLSAAEERLSLRLPAALREWYGESAGNRRVWSEQDDLLPPEEVVLRDHHLAIMQECQAVVIWGIPRDNLDDPDPPIHQIEWNSLSSEWPPGWVSR